MKMLILNGSPKGNIEKSNTQIFIQQFISGIKAKCEVRYIEKEDPTELVRDMHEFEVILMVMPLYIHAMPSGVMKLIEHMKLGDFKKQKIGFIVQAGFPEGIHEKYIKEYFEVLTRKLNCQYLGTVIKGNAAFIYRKPQKYVKLFKMIKELGTKFESTGQFDEQIVEQLGQPYQLSKSLLYVLRILEKTSLFNYEWKIILKQNGALEHALDRPFLNV